MAAKPSRIPMFPNESLVGHPALRADARHNRDRIVQVARQAFAESGLDVPMAEIARRAGVGVATLYRRFPTKEALAAEVFTEQLAACAATMDEAHADPDAWRGFCTVVEKICAMQAVDSGFREAFLAAFPGATAFEQQRARARHSFAALTRRAQAQGHLRLDFVPEDLTLLIMANGGLLADSEGETLAASRRLVAYLLHAFRAHPATPPPPLPTGGTQPPSGADEPVG